MSAGFPTPHEDGQKGRSSLFALEIEAVTRENFPAFILKGSRRSNGT